MIEVIEVTTVLPRPPAPQISVSSAADVGQSRRFGSILAMSAHPPTAAEKRTLPDVANVPLGDIGAPIRSRRRRWRVHQMEWKDREPSRSLD